MQIVGGSECGSIMRDALGESGVGVNLVYEGFLLGLSWMMGVLKISVLCQVSGLIHKGC